MQAAAQETPSERVAAARAFLAFFSTHMVGHFRREEETVFPLLDEVDGEDRALLVSALLHHQRLHALATRLADELAADAVSPKLLSETGVLVESHVRLEERRLFPLVEQLAGQRLDQLVHPAQDSPVVNLDAAEGEGPLWGTASNDLNVTMLSWHPGSATPKHVNDECDVLLVCLAGSGTVQLGANARYPFAEGQILIIEKGVSRRIESGRHGLRYLSVHLKRPGLRITSLVSAD